MLPRLWERASGRGTSYISSEAYQEAADHECPTQGEPRSPWATGTLFGFTASLPSAEHQQGQQVLGTRTAKVRKWLTQGKAQDPANVLSLVPGFICSWVQHTLKAEKQSGFTVWTEEPWRRSGKDLFKKTYFRVFPGSPVAKALVLPMPGAQVQPLIGELDPTCHN